MKFAQTHKLYWLNTMIAYNVINYNISSNNRQWNVTWERYYHILVYTSLHAFHSDCHVILALFQIFVRQILWLTVHNSHIISPNLQLFNTEVDSGLTWKGSNDTLIATLPQELIHIRSAIATLLCVFHIWPLLQCQHWSSSEHLCFVYTISTYITKIKGT